MGTDIDRACLRAIHPALINRAPARDVLRVRAFVRKQARNRLAICTRKLVVAFRLSCFSAYFLRTARRLFVRSIFFSPTTKTKTQRQEDKKEEEEEEDEEKKKERGFPMQRKLTARCIHAAKPRNVTVERKVVSTLRNAKRQRLQRFQQSSRLTSERRGEATRRTKPPRRRFRGGRLKLLPK